MYARDVRSQLGTPTTMSIAPVPIASSRSDPPDATTHPVLVYAKDAKVRKAREGSRSRPLICLYFASFAPLCVRCVLHSCKGQRGDAGDSDHVHRPGPDGRVEIRPTWRYERPCFGVRKGPQSTRKKQKPSVHSALLCVLCATLRPLRPPFKQWPARGCRPVPAVFALPAGDAGDHVQRLGPDGAMAIRPA